MQYIIVLCLLFAGVFIPARTARAEIDVRKVIPAIITEASGEPEEGKLAIMEVIRRRGSLRGFCGLKMHALEVFVAQEKRYYHAKTGRNLETDLRALWEKSKYTNVSKDADHFENIEVFGVPSWARGKTPVVVIGRHSFYKLKGK